MKVEELFNELDPDGDKTLTKDETWTFVQRISEQTKKSITKEEFDEAYSKLDWDADGQVTLDEIRKQGIDKADTKEQLSIGIVWIGHTLDPGYLPH